jgi:mono/diheme cytochrome c family protein
MRGPALLLLVSMTVSAMGFGAANGAWLKKVPQADRERANPYAGNAEAVAAGKNLFQENCAKCHGENADGKGSRPSLKSDRIKNATDGELAWLLKNGNPYKGMPIWAGLPEQERWQIIAYIRSLNVLPAEVQK